MKAAAHPSCVYCRLARGELPRVVVYEDDALLAFFDVAPLTVGHAVLLPKAHYPSILAVPPAVLARLWTVAPVLAQAIVREIGADGFNLHVANSGCAGQVVLHACVHLIPRHPTDGFAWGGRALAPPDETAARALAARVALRYALRQPAADDPSAGAPANDPDTEAATP